MKKILAIIGIVFLLLLYVLTLIFALIDDPRTLHMFGACIGATVLVPVMLWAGLLLLKGREENKKILSESKEENK